MQKEKSSIDDVLRLIDIEIHKRGWKRKNLVKALDKSDAWLSKIMNKKRGLSLQILFDIAEVLEIDPASLLPKLNNPKPRLSFDEYIWFAIKEKLDKHIDEKLKKIK